MTTIASVPNIAAIVLWIIFLNLMMVAAHVFLGLCVYNDARYRRDGNAVLWGVLSGIFGIAALIYLIVRFSMNNQPRRCARCGVPLIQGIRFCGYCGLPVELPSPEEMQKYSRRRKLFLWLWIGLAVLTALAAVVFFAVFIGNLIQYSLDGGYPIYRHYR